MFANNKSAASWLRSVVTSLVKVLVSHVVPPSSDSKTYPSAALIIVLPSDHVIDANVFDVPPSNSVQVTPESVDFKILPPVPTAINAS